MWEIGTHNSFSSFCRSTHYAIQTQKIYAIILSLLGVQKIFSTENSTDTWQCSAIRASDQKNEDKSLEVSRNKWYTIYNTHEDYIKRKRKSP